MNFINLAAVLVLTLSAAFSAMPVRADTTIVSEQCGDGAAEMVVFFYYLTEDPKQVFAELSRSGSFELSPDILKSARPSESVSADVDRWTIQNRSYLSSLSAPSTTFEPCTLTLQIDGAISEQDVVSLNLILNQYHNPPFIHAYLNSTGGDINPALEIGRIFRKHYATITVGNHSDFNGSPSIGCLSACVLIYASGIAKDIDPYVDGIGVHQSFLPESYVETISVENGVELLRRNNESIGRYFDEMGVSRELLILSNSVGKEHIRLLTEQELKAYLPFVVSEYAAILPIKIEQALANVGILTFSAMEVAMIELGSEKTLLEYLRAWEDVMEANFEATRWAYGPRYALEVGSWNQSN